MSVQRTLFSSRPGQARHDRKSVTLCVAIFFYFCTECAGVSQIDVFEHFPKNVSGRIMYNGFYYTRYLDCEHSRILQCEIHF